LHSLRHRTCWLRQLTVSAAVTVATPDQLEPLRPVILPALLFYSNWHEIAEHGSYFAAFGPPALVGGLAAILTAVACVGIFRAPPGSGLTGQITQGQHAIATSQIARSHANSRDFRGYGDERHGSLTTTRGRGAARRVATAVRRNKRMCGGNSITAIGDSVMVASAAELAARLRGVYIDAVVGRQMAAGFEVARTLAAGHLLRPVLVVGLGTNGPVTARQVRELARVAGPRRVLVLVTAFVPRPWEAEVNRVLRAAARRHALVADWPRAIAGRTYLLWNDGVHPRPAGGRLYADVVARAVARVCA
jgi:hypothetical protein